MSLFKKITLIPPDAMFGLDAILKKDSRKEKINLVIGYAKGEDEKTLLFPSVKQAEKKLLSVETTKEYFPIAGSSFFLDALCSLIFGKSLYETRRSCIAAVQSVGGTSGLYTLGKFIANALPKRPIYISDPTWSNHRSIFENAGFEVLSYPYYDSKKHTLCLSKMLSFLSKVKSGSYVLLQASCHNPCGLDPSLEDWKQLSSLFLKKNLIPIFDLAYQGFGEGFTPDAACIRLFVEMGHEVFVGYSCSKNFSLYGERTGACFILSQTSSQTEAISSHLKQIIRATYSNPPIHGALIVETILKNEDLKGMWEQELTKARNRIKNLRLQLERSLENKTGIAYPHIGAGKGMFFFTGLKKTAVLSLRENKAIYLTQDGRMNITGLNAKNFTKVVEAIANLITKKK